MAARFRRRHRVLHQRGADAELAAGRVDRERAEHQRGHATGAHVPQPHGSDQLALAHDRKGQAFGGRASVAQALAGARMAVRAKAGIEQRFTRDDVRGSLRTDRERRGIGFEGNRGVPQSSHGTSVLAPAGGAPRSVVSNSQMKGREPAHRLPILQLASRKREAVSLRCDTSSAAGSR